MTQKKECIKRKSYGDTLYLAFKKDNYDEAHGTVLDLLKDMGFESPYLMQFLDISFESYSDFFMPLFVEWGIVDIFIGGSLVHLVFHFKDETEKRKKVPIIRKYFNY